MIKTKPIYNILSRDLSIQERDLKMRHSDYAKVYATAEGKKVIDDILYYSAIDRTAYCAKQESQTLFNLGKQSVGYYVAAALEPVVLLPQQTNEENDD